MLEVEHPLKHRRPAIEAGVVWSDDGSNRGIEYSQPLCNDIDTMVPEGIPLHAGSVLIGIAELAEDERRAAIQLPFLRDDKGPHRRLEAVVEGRGDGNRAVGTEVVQPSKEVLAVGGEPTPFTPPSAASMR